MSDNGNHAFTYEIELTICCLSSYLIFYSGYDKEQKRYNIQPRLQQIFKFRDVKDSVNEINKVLAFSGLTLYSYSFMRFMTFIRYDSYKLRKYAYALLGVYAFLDRYFATDTFAEIYGMYQIHRANLTNYVSHALEITSEHLYAFKVATKHIKVGKAVRTYSEAIHHNDLKDIDYVSTSSDSDAYDADEDEEKEEPIDIATFLRNLGPDYEQYIETFTQNKYETVHDIKQITNNDLIALGVLPLKHKNGIRQGIGEYFCSYNEALKKPIKCVDDALVIFFGVAKYEDSQSYKTLNDIDKDEEYFRNTFEKKFGYKMIANDYKNKAWTKSDANDWIESIRDDYLIQNRIIQYNGLIFIGAGHGSTHAMICSDGKQLKVKDIRSKFAANVKKEFSNVPKLFVFNCCRTEVEETRAKQTESSAVDYSATVTGSEGDEVFGPKLSRYVTDAFMNCKQPKLLDTIQMARRNATDDGDDIKIRLQESDPDVYNVIFKKKAQSRGGPHTRFGSDIRQISRDHVDKKKKAIVPSTSTTNLAIE